MSPGARREVLAADDGPAAVRPVDPVAGGAEEIEEAGLRPRSLAEFIGQPDLVEHLAIVLQAARRRGKPVDHLLFAGPPGLGKTSLAGIVAAEMGVGFRVTSGPVLARAGDLAALLTDLQDGDVLFIDEIHRLHRSVEEILYPAMEDAKVDILIGKGPTARSIRLDLPHFTLIGATTRTGLVAGPCGTVSASSVASISTDPSSSKPSCCARPTSSRWRSTSRRRPDRPTVARHPSDRQPTAAPSPRLRRGPRRRGDH